MGGPRRRIRSRKAPNVTVNVIGGGVAPGDVDQTVLIGSDTQDDTESAVGTLTEDLGTQTESDGDLLAVLVVPAGTVTETLTQIATGALDAQLGVDTQSYGESLTATVSFPAGSQTETAGNALIALLAVPVGTQTESFDPVDVTGTAAGTAGTDTQSLSVDLVGSGSGADMGGDSQSQSVDSTATTVSQPTAHTVDQNWSSTPADDNSQDWANIINAYAESLGDATISATAGTLSNQGFDDRIRFGTFDIDGDIPSGWSRTLVNVVVRYGFDFTFSHILGNDELQILLRDTVNATTVQTLRSFTNINTTEATKTDTYDVTTAVNALTASEIEALEVWFGVGAFVPLPSGNASVNLDFVRIEMTFTRSGIT